MEKDYFDIKNESLFQFLQDLFEINKVKDWDTISKNITIEKVKRTYRKFAELFPRNIDYLTELEKSKTTFTSIHYGRIKAISIIDEIVRFSLYSDKIIVFHPLQNPAVTNQRIDPRKNPKYWLPDFLDSLYFYIVIQKWVRSGIVKLIINPYEYNLKLRDSIDKQVEKRMLNSNSTEYYKLGIDPAMENLAIPFSRIYKNRSKEYIIQSLLKMEQPKFSILQAEKFSEKIIAGFSTINPFYNKLNIPLDERTIEPTKGGGPLESILLIAEKTNGNIYTPSEMNWRQINDWGLNDFWTKTNRVYSKIPLNFLNNVETNFALNLRKEERLAGVRSQLKKIYSELNNLDVNNLTDLKVRELQEELIEEIRKAEAEWEDIKKQANLARKYWLGANIGIPLITNNVSLLPLALGSVAWLYNNEQGTFQKKKLQKIKNPVSVFVDLKNQKQNFFSELKNCLF